MSAFELVAERQHSLCRTFVHACCRSWHFQLRKRDEKMDDAAAGATRKNDAAVSLQPGSMPWQAAAERGTGDGNEAVDQAPLAQLSAQQREQPTPVPGHSIPTLTTSTAGSQGTEASSQPSPRPQDADAVAAAEVQQSAAVPSSGATAPEALVTMLLSRPTAAVVADAAAAAPAAATAPALPQLIKPRGAHQRKRPPQRSEPEGAPQRSSGGAVDASSSGDDATPLAVDRPRRCSATSGFPVAQLQPDGLPPAKRPRTEDAQAADDGVLPAAHQRTIHKAFGSSHYPVSAHQRAITNDFGSSHYPAFVAAQLDPATAALARSGSSSPEHHTAGGHSYWKRPWRRQAADESGQSPLPHQVRPAAVQCHCSQYPASSWLPLPAQVPA